jgi:hypothetical protein
LVKFSDTLSLGLSPPLEIEYELMMGSVSSMVRYGW